MINLLLVIFLIVILLFVNKETFLVPEGDKEREILRRRAGKDMRRTNCFPETVNDDYPKDTDQVFDSVMMYKYYSNNMNSNLSSIYYSPEVVRNTPRLRNRPNLNDEAYLIGASNEGTSTGHKCRKCNDETNLLACMQNVSIMEDDYCPIIKQCKGMPIMQNSDSYKTPQGMDDNVKSTRALIEDLSKTREVVVDGEEYRCKQILCYIRNNSEFKIQFDIFKEIYGTIRDKLYNEDPTMIGSDDNLNIDFTKINDPNISKIVDFFNNPLNICLFNLPSRFRAKVVNSDGQENIYYTRKEIEMATPFSEIEVLNAFKNPGTTVTNNNTSIMVYLDNKDTNDYMSFCLRTMIDFATDLNTCFQYRNVECD
jgi:hypothetical protein